MTLTVREAMHQDETEVSDLWGQCGLVASHNDPRSDFRFACSGSASTVLVGLEAGRIIGSVMVGHDGHRGWLYYVACSPDRRKSGVGRQMVASAENWLRLRGVVKVHLMVRETNAEVTEFYERLGFEFMPRIAMAKWLDQ
ncbi:MAG: GNAT family acetyltransferase [Janthinobacterium lividum]